ncbi:MAG: GGDEF domain-containing protein [Alphaproteobacteria bacterium]|nr:GGDEF domain-containing protein [Alphaproteobacteria bacterium]
MPSLTNTDRREQQTPRFPLPGGYSNALNAYAFAPIEAKRSLTPTLLTSDKEQALSLLEDAQRTIAEQEQRIRSLEKLAQCDELTGLLNRRGFTAALRRELANARRFRNHGALLILIDLDDFKQVNDQFGHMVGDGYLQTAASVLLNEVRGTDYVGRIGGDEFAILMTHLSAKDAKKRIDHLDRVFHKRVMHDAPQSLPLKASFGFAMVTETDTAESLFVSADMKLYADKARRKMAHTQAATQSRTPQEA